MKPLSDEPDIMEGNLPRDLKGSFLIRVTARNIGGLGATSELIVVLEGQY